jgi:hypothetical protein
MASYSTYAERYADSALDPFKGDFRGIMNHSRAAATGRESDRTVAKLEAGVWETSESQLHAYLALVGEVEKPEELRVYVLHRPWQLVPPLGSGRSTENYVFASDIMRNQAPVTVYWPTDSFVKTAQVTIPSSNVLDTAFTEDPALQFVGPYQDDETGTDAVCTRPLMYLPPPFVSAAFTHSPMTPRRAWEIIGGSIRTDPAAERLVAELKPLLDWLKVACTQTGVPQVAQEIIIGFPVPVFPQPAGYHDKLERILNLEVPSWQGVQAPAGVEQVAAAVNSLTDRLRDNQEDSLRRTLEASDKTPTKYWGAATLLANRITWTSTTDELPKLYHVIAKSTKTNLRLLVSEHLRMVAQEMGMEGSAPVVTPSLAKKLSALQFSHHNIDDLDDGIQPFVVGVRSKQDQATLNRYITYYDSIVEGGAAAGLQDLKTLAEKDKAAIPRTLLQASTTLQQFHVLLRAILPETHGLVIQYARFCRAFQQRLAQLEDHASPQFAAQIVRYLQIRISNWFTDQEESSGPVDAPVFMELLSRIQNRDSAWVPLMPGVPPPDKLKDSTEKAPAATSPKKRDADTAPVPVEKVKGERVNNPSYDDSFAHYKSKGVPLKTVRENAIAANHPVPNGVHGEMCLSYHVLGFCWSTCARKAGHQVLTAPDKTKLLNWCREVYV